VVASGTSLSYCFTVASAHDRPGGRRLPDARIEPGIVGAVGNPSVRFGGGTLLLLADRFFDGSANERRPTPRPAWSDLFELLEGILIDLDQ